MAAVLFVPTVLVAVYGIFPGYLVRESRLNRQREQRGGGGSVDPPPQPETVP